VKPQELKLATQLIEQLATSEFKPETYRDEVREQTIELIQQKVEGKEITLAPAEEPQVQIIDLMAALKASLKEDSDRKPAERAGKKGAASARKSGVKASESAGKSTGRRKASSE
jgi:DNA end-binding protein Ku